MTIFQVMFFFFTPSKLGEDIGYAIKKHEGFCPTPQKIWVKNSSKYESCGKTIAGCQKNTTG